jgi:hypothetical protein
MLGPIGGRINQVGRRIFAKLPSAVAALKGWWEMRISL